MIDKIFNTDTPESIKKSIFVTAFVILSFYFSQTDIPIIDLTTTLTGTNEQNTIKEISNKHIRWALGTIQLTLLVHLALHINRLILRQRVNEITTHLNEQEAETADTLKKIITDAKSIQETIQNSESLVENMVSDHISSGSEIDKMVDEIEKNKKMHSIKYNERYATDRMEAAAQSLTYKLDSGGSRVDAPENFKSAYNEYIKELTIIIKEQDEKLSEVNRITRLPEHKDIIRLTTYNLDDVHKLNGRLQSIDAKRKEAIESLSHSIETFSSVKSTKYEEGKLNGTYKRAQLETIATTVINGIAFPVAASILTVYLAFCNPEYLRDAIITEETVSEVIEEISAPPT